MTRSMNLVRLVFFMAAVVPAACVLAETKFFTPPGGIGNWDVMDNWSGGSLPDADDTAIVHADREATINTDVGTINFLRVGDLDTGRVDFQPGASLTVTAQALFGLGGGLAGFSEHTGGTLNVDDALFLAFESFQSADYTISDGEINTFNLWFRFGNGTMTQKGGTVNVSNNLVLGEGGTAASASLFDLRGGNLNVEFANIGQNPGVGDPFPNSNGSMNISGGLATFGELLFGDDPTDQINMFPGGILRVRQENYSEADALADIGADNITGLNLAVSTVDVGGTTFTEIISIPEPSTIALVIIGCLASLVFFRR